MVQIRPSHHFSNATFPQCQKCPGQNMRTCGSGSA